MHFKEICDPVEVYEKTALTFPLLMTPENTFLKLFGGDVIAHSPSQLISQ